MQKKEKSFGKVIIYHRCTLPALCTLGCSNAFLLFRCFCVFLKDPKYYCCNCFERLLLKPINHARCNKYCYILCEPSLCGCKDTTTKGWSINSARDSLLECIQMLSVQPDTKPKGCAGCNRKIKDRYLLKALDKYWHEDCLKCACCDCRLGEVGSTLYTKANLILCRRDYLRLFGVTGNCAACSKLIPAFEMVMRAKDNVYHLDCFACQLCNQRFCVGDKFFLKNNMILCQTDYEEGLMKEGYAPQVR
ncbi:LIM domain only protein 3 isoform X1 [Callithrix jacchus]|uniref:LIM domain only protein 3 isoform X1 n=1 Tax=Callithrix jacchus TaxID=9483 RepID=UPI0023DD47B6|nr:LIM domain only protein 3 isoform X1 [Callithrix jacchus]